MNKLHLRFQGQAFFIPYANHLPFYLLFPWTLFSQQYQLIGFRFNNTVVSIALPFLKSWINEMSDYMFMFMCKLEWYPILKQMHKIFFPWVYVAPVCPCHSLSALNDCKSFWLFVKVPSIDNYRSKTVKKRQKQVSSSPNF